MLVMSWPLQTALLLTTASKADAYRATKPETPSVKNAPIAQASLFRHVGRSISGTQIFNEVSLGEFVSLK